MAKELFINRRFDSLAEAQEAARRELHRHNRAQITGSVGMVGDPSFSAGLNINLVGAGQLDGKYHVESVTHEYSPAGGFTSSLSLRMSAPEGIAPERVKTSTGRAKSAAVVPPDDGGEYL